MNELKEGMYVRTKHGISIIDEERRIEYGMFHPVIDILKKEIIIKASYNIIDLIEVGDYVNGYEVTSKDQFLGFGNHDWYMLDNEIKSIVTKEQFESMSYKVGD